MTRTRPLAAATAAALAFLAPAAPASAGSAAPAPGLYLTLTGAGHTWTRGVLLTCPGGDSGHPFAAEACTALEAVGGDPGALPVAARPCTREYAPVLAGAAGNWQGRPVAWHRTFANRCTLDAGTGPLFRF